MLCCWVLWPASAAAFHMEGALDVGARGGYETNLNHTSGGRREGSGFGTLWIAVGASRDLHENDRLFIGAAYEGLFYADFNDLSYNSFKLHGGVGHRLIGRTLLLLIPELSVASFGDKDRDSTAVGSELAVRHLISPVFSSRLAYEFTRNMAEESVFSFTAHRIGLSGEVRAGESHYITGGYSLTFAESVFYQSSALALPSGARGRRPLGTFGVNEVVFKADAVSHGFSLDWDREFLENSFLLAEYVFTYADADVGDYSDHLVSVGVAYRF